MGRQRTLDYDEAYEYWKANIQMHGLEYIADHFNVSTATICRIVREKNKKDPFTFKKSRKKGSSHDHEKIYEFWKNNKDHMEVSEIAKHCNCHASTVSYVLNKKLDKEHRERIKMKKSILPEATDTSYVAWNKTSRTIEEKERKDHFDNVTRVMNISKEENSILREHKRETIEQEMLRKQEEREQRVRENNSKIF